KQPARSVRSVTAPDGETRSYEYVISPIISAGGEIELVVWSGRDVTKRAVAELHATQLQLLSQRLAATLSRDEIAHIVIEQLHELLGANASVAYFMRGDGMLELAAHRGIPEQIAIHRAAVSLDTPLPLATAAQTRTLLTYETREVLMRDYPNLANTTSAFEAVCAVPLVLDQRLFGAIALSFARP